MTLIQKKSKSQPKKKSQNYQRGVVGGGQWQTETETGGKISYMKLFFSKMIHNF